MKKAGLLSASKVHSSGLEGCFVQVRPSAIIRREFKMRTSGWGVPRG